MFSSITVESLNAPSDDAKTFEKGMVAGLREAPAHWQRAIMPHHFGRAAGPKYGYKIRSARYLARKWKKKHHQDDLVYSGEARRQMRGRYDRARVSRIPTGRSATLKIHAPAYFYKYRPGQPDKAAEVVATTEDEANELREVIENTIDQTLARAHVRKVRKL